MCVPPLCSPGPSFGFEGNVSKYAWLKQQILEYQSTQQLRNKPHSSVQLTGHSLCMDNSWLLQLRHTYIGNQRIVITGHLMKFQPKDNHAIDNDDV